jgi:hypothetical protein
MSLVRANSLAVAFIYVQGHARKHDACIRLYLVYSIRIGYGIFLSKLRAVRVYVHVVICVPQYGPVKGSDIRVLWIFRQKRA